MSWKMTNEECLISLGIIQSKREDKFSLFYDPKDGVGVAYGPMKTGNERFLKEAFTIPAHSKEEAKLKLTEAIDAWTDIFPI